MEEEMGDLRGASFDEFLPRLSSEDGKKREKDGVEVSLDCDEGEEEEDEEEFDSDSGMGSDDFDLLEVGGESGTEFCQVGDQTCSVPWELYDLSNLSEVLSLDVWNECLSKDEKFSLCKYFPDLDQATFMRTLKDLLSSSNIYFGNPVSRFFNMLKGGLCEPSVSLRRQGLMFFQKQQYYHFLRNYQNNMVSNCFRVKEVWSYCNGRSLEDKIKFLNDMTKERRRARDNVPSRSFEGDSSGKDENPIELSWSERIMYRNGGQLKGHHSFKFSNQNGARMSPKGFPKLMGTRQKNKTEHDGTSRIVYDAPDRRDQNLFNRRAMEEIGLPKLKKRKKHEGLKANSSSYDAVPELSSKKNMSDIKDLISEMHRKGKHPEKLMPSSQAAVSLDFYFKDDQNVGRKKGKLRRRSPVLNMNSNGTSFSPISNAARNNDTESDSSDLRDEAVYGYHLNNKLDYVRPGQACGRFADSKVTRHKKRKTGRVPPFEVVTSSKKFVNLSDQLARVDNRTSKMKRKARNINSDSFHFVQNSENQSLSHDHAVNSNGLTSPSHRLGNKCNYVEFPVDKDDALLDARGLVEDVVKGRLNKGIIKKIFVSDVHDNSVTPMLRCSSAKKKSKVGKGAIKLGKFNDAQSVTQQPESDATNPIDIQTSDAYAMETEMMNVEPDPTPPRKTCTLITPTVDCSFIFSIMHLLSAVRIALSTPHLEDSLGLQHEIQEAQTRTSGEVSNGIHSNESINGGNTGRLGQDGVPTLSIQEIVNRVRLNSGDPCILKTPEPLSDLVRGVLKIFSSKLAPQGAKGWKPIAKYERSSKSWSWIGPLNRTLSDTENMEEVTSPESWGLPHRMLVKLVDTFAIWLKNSQETLRELGSLPPPPASLMQFNIEAKDRLKDLKAQKSLRTIGPSTEEVRDYFRREEYLRYSIPDRAFSYTAADGKKSAVAPLRRGGGKPSAKVRDHFMLKSDRPPHVTILCLVRDAAARLPGSIGTRADVCTLIRDSQYISEDVTDNQVTQILSGALDRLHYEQDPCVRFEQERKLWVYLHRDRDEEDFDEDGTLSTKKWKKKKEATDQATDGVVNEQQTVNVVAEAPQLDLVSYQSVDVDHEQQTVNLVAEAPQLDLVRYQSVDVDHNNYESVRDN